MPKRLLQSGHMLCAIFGALLGMVSPVWADTPAYVWIEGEVPTSVVPAAASPTPAGSSWGRGDEVLSNGKWLSLSIDAAKVDAQVPAEGIVLSYTFTSPKAASYDLWNRVGYEKVRSPFDWRVDNGVWNTVAPDQDTVDVADLQDWNPLGWLKMGARQISPGQHTLQIRLVKTKDEKGSFRNIQYASDALCLVAGPFHPSGRLKPDQTDGAADADRAAAVHVFQMPAPQGPAQATLSLKGDWQVAADDEVVVEDRLGPIKAAPAMADLLWSAVPIPGDRNAARADMQYVHRYWLRTQVHVPAEAAGRSFYLHVPAESMIATVFVNGKQCGWTKSPYAIWDCDVTPAINPGQVNEILIGIKDAFYGLANADNAKHLQYTPYNFWHFNTTNQLDMPVLSRYETGLLLEPTLVTAGKAYTSDVFAIPSVRTKSLELDVTVTNPTAQAMTVAVANEVVPLGGGAAEKTFAPKDLTVPANRSAVLKLSEGWANPKLWWPDDPQQYNVVTTLRINGQPADRRTTKFGFREWGVRGAQFTLNGVPWHGRADLVDFDKADADAVATWRKHGQTMERVWGNGYTWGGMDVNQALDFFDAHGVPVRRTGIFDGEGAAGFYNLTEQDRGGKTVARRALFDNWRDQLAAWARGQRNHPSIFIWSMENEITFINSSVFGNNPYTDPEMRAAATMLAALDPTRPQMTDGGNALLDQSLPIYGGHYMEPSFQSLPEGAYDKAAFAHRQKWPVTQEKPILLGESYFATGNEPQDYATVGGEAAFVGKAEARPAVGLVARMLSEGYRWNGVSFHYWMGGQSDAYYNSWQPVAVLCRQWDSTFASGQKVERTLGIFNDTRNAGPITLTSTLFIGGKPFARQVSVHHVMPGLDEKFNIVLSLPRVASRQDGQWVLALTRGGKQVFKDVRPISLLNTGLGSAEARAASRSCPTPTHLAVFDPGGLVAAFLRARAIPFTRIAGLARLPSEAKVLIVGTDALTPAQSTSSALAAYAAGGHSVLLLEQKSPLRFQGLPGDMPPDSDAGQGDIAFGEDMDHPILRGLRQRDFFTWGPDGTVYKNPYVKPASGGRSLVQCGLRLQDTALTSMPVGRGLLLISQLMIGQKLTTNAVAQRLLLNMISYGAQYKQLFHPVTVAADDNAPLTKALDASGLQYAKASDPIEAISKRGSIAVINASRANLHALASQAAKVNAFTRSGGWVIFNNLTPAGLADYDRIVGYPHIIRPFTQEKVTWPAVRNPLTAGLPTSNIVMGSGKQIFNFAAGQYPDTDAFGDVVDIDDVAPFGKSSFFAYDKITNNYTMADSFWPLIINFPMNKDGSPYQIPITLPRPETITRFTYVQDLNYAGTTKISLIFDGKDKVPLTLQVNGDPQSFEITPPRTAQNLTLEIDDWQHDPAKQHDGQDLIGIDNIYLYAKRPTGFAQEVKPMLNIGAMVEYPRGAGGLVLCNVKYKDTEAVPENAAKKQTILATILRNLNAPFAGGKTLIAGANNLTYYPLDISRQANQYRSDQGWFGDKQFTFADLPTGDQRFAGVKYRVYSFTTSPVPTAIMLGGDRIPGNLPDHVSGIPVGRKADALFFLQAARIDQRRSADDVKHNRQFEMADYIIHYADGQTVKVPIDAEVNVDNYQQETPTPLPGAQIAWVRAYAGSKFSAVAYSMQWNNPRPNVPILSLDLVSGPDRRGVPALLAVTAATAK